MINLIYNSMRKRVISTILIVINTIISIILIYNLMITTPYHKINEDIIGKYVNLNSTMMLGYRGMDKSPEQVEKDIEKIDKVLENNDVKFGGYEYTNNSFNELEENEGYINKNKVIWKNDIAGQYPQSSKIMFVDKNSINFIVGDNKSLEVLRNYKKTDSEIPLICGDAYREFIKIGQVFTDPEGVKYKIVGFLSKGSSCISKGEFYCDMPVILDDYFVIPYNNKSKFNTYAINVMASSYVIDAKSVEKMKSIKNELKKYTTDEKIEINPSIISDLVNMWKENYGEYITFIGLISITVLLFVIIINSISMISSIEDRQYEIAVLISQGASNKFLIAYVFIENLTISIFSFVVAIILNFTNKSGHVLFVLINNTVDISKIIIVGVICLVICVVSSLVPIRRILKIKPSKLLME